MKLIDNYRRYKWFFTSSNKLVVGGKSAEQNEELLHLIKKERQAFVVMHTSTPGSPFSVILDESPGKNDLEEAAVFTACFSQAWKSGKKIAEVDIFKSSQLSKSGKMKTGTWGVLGSVKTVVVPLELFLTRQNKVMRAVPERSAQEKIIKIIPGKIDKKDILKKIQVETGLHFSEEELLSALPAGGIRIENIKRKK